MKLISLLFIPFIFIGSIALSAPTISSSYSTTISGSEFGTKSPAAPIMFDDFEEGTNSSSLQSISSDWKEYNSLGGALYDNQQAYSGTLSAYNYRNSETGERREFATNYITIPASDEVFISYKCYQSGTGGKYGIGKLCRITSSSSSGGGGIYDGVGDSGFSNVNLYYGKAGYIHMNNGVKTFDPLPDSYTTTAEDSWFTVEMYKKLSTAGLDDGVIFCNTVGIDSYLSESAVTRGAGQSFQQDTVLLGLMIANVGSLGGSASRSVWIDDIYIDNTQSRVVIGDNSIYGSCTHREIQIPTSWSDTEISVTWNQGSFENYTPVYIFVVDENGDASNGLEGFFVDGTFYDSASSPSISTIQGKSFISGKVIIGKVVTEEEPEVEPTYSTDKCTGGTAISKGDNPPNEPDDYAFDNNTATKWLEFKTDGFPLWIGYDFGDGVTWKIAKYTITTANDAEERDPKVWTLQASNTGAWGGEEVTVDTITNGELPAGRGESKEFICDSPPSTAYRYYRLLITELKNSGTANSTQIAEIEMMVQTN